MVHVSAIGLLFHPRNVLLLIMLLFLPKITVTSEFTRVNEAIEKIVGASPAMMRPVRFHPSPISSENAQPLDSLLALWCLRRRSP